MSRWQPISTAPKDDEDRLFFIADTPGCQVFVGWYYAGLKRWIEAYSGTPRKPTHWMPLPDPPLPPASVPGGEREE